MVIVGHLLFKFASKDWVVPPHILIIRLYKTHLIVYIIIYASGYCNTCDHKVAADKMGMGCDGDWNLIPIS